MSGREFTRSVGRSVGRSLGRKLLFVFPLTNAQLDLTKRKMSSNGSAHVKHSETCQQHVVLAFSYLQQSQNIYFIMQNSRSLKEAFDSSLFLVLFSYLWKTCSQ